MGGHKQLRGRKVRRDSAVIEETFVGAPRVVHERKEYHKSYGKKTFCLIPLLLLLSYSQK